MFRSRSKDVSFLRLIVEGQFEGKWQAKIPIWTDRAIFQDDHSERLE